MTDRGRPREFARENALQQAMLLFWRKGFSATSMNDLCDAMEIRSPSLYAAFGSKGALYLEAIEHNAKTVGLPLIWSHLTNAATSREGVENMLFAAAEGLPGNDIYPAGCMLTLASMGESCPGEIPHALKKFRAQLLDMLRSRLSDAVHADELSADANVDQLARFFLATYQGISTQARDGATAEELRSIAATALTAWPPMKLPRHRRAGIRRRSSRAKTNQER